jgi:hypothetical protein
VKRGKLLRERIIDLPRQLERSGSDPFLVDVKGLLKRLKEDRKRSVELLKLDSAAINAVSKVIRMQEQWVVDALRGLRVDPQLVRDKLKDMELKEIMGLLASNFYPILGLRRMSGGRLKDGLSYWGIVQPWGSVAMVPPVSYREVSFEPVELSMESMKVKAASLLRRLERELERGPIDYYAFLSGFKGRERLETAFLLGHLAMTGKIALKQEPLTRRVFIMKPRDGEPVSLALPLEVKPFGR